MSLLNFHDSVQAAANCRARDPGDGGLNFFLVSVLVRWYTCTVSGPCTPSGQRLMQMVSSHTRLNVLVACEGRAKDNPRKAGPDSAAMEFPVVSMDWCYLVQKDDAPSLPVFATRDSKSKSIFARGTPGTDIVSRRWSGMSTVLNTRGSR